MHTGAPQRFLIQSKFLDIAKARAGKKRPGVMRNVHVRGGAEGRQVVEASDGTVTFIVDTSNGNKDHDFSMDVDTLLSREAIEAALSSAEGGLVHINTRYVDSGEEGSEIRYRETILGMQDETTIRVHAPGDDFPNLDGLMDREAHRATLSATFDQVAVAKAIGIMRKVSGVDNVTIRYPLMDPTAPLALVAEDGRHRFLGFVNPVVEISAGVSVRWALMVQAVCQFMEAANEDGELAMGKIEIASMKARLSELARKAMESVTAKRKPGEKAPDPQQVLFDEFKPMVDAFDAAEAKKAEEAKRKKAAKTPDMLPAADPNVVDSNERQVVRPGVNEATGEGMTDEEWEESAGGGDEEDEEGEDE